jgi:broad specificity phosphatase PhoE
MPKIYLVRHGKAERGWGEEKDPGLSDLGRMQADSMARTMVPLGPMPVFASPMSRTRQTAAPLARLWNLTPKIEPRVSEIPTPDEPEADRPQWLKTVMSDKWPNLNRDLNAWRREVIATLCDFNRDVVVVSHFIAINAAVGEALGDNRVVIFKPDNASITVIEAGHRTLKLIQLGAQDNTLVL